MKDDDWRRELKTGDDVVWTDPDEGKCSRTGQIVNIEYFGDDCARITWDRGDVTEVRLEEIS